MYTSNKKPFKGLKVIELASVLSGPSVGMFFAELGAHVLKIENPKTGGDVTREWKHQSESPEKKDSAYYQSVNWGKKVKFWDLSKPVDLNKLHKLIPKTDIVIANYKGNDDKKLGVDYQTIKKLNPKIIYGKLEGFPNSNRVAFDLVLQAETGFMSMNGTSESGPVKMPVALIDLMAGHQLKEGILCALLKLQKTKKGSLIKVSLFDAAISALANQASNYLINKQIPKLAGSLHPNIAPYGELLKSSDNQLFTLAIGSDLQFDKLCEIFGVKTPNEFKNNLLRLKNRTKLYAFLTKNIQKINSNELYKQFEELNIPYGKVKNLMEVLSVLDSGYFLNYLNGQKIVKSVAFYTS